MEIEKERHILRKGKEKQKDTNETKKNIRRTISIDAQMKTKQNKQTNKQRPGIAYSAGIIIINNKRENDARQGMMKIRKTVDIRWWLPLCMEDHDKN